MTREWRRGGQVLLNQIERPPLDGGEFSSVRLRLLKVAVRVNETASRIRLAFAANCPDAVRCRELVPTLLPRPT